MSQVETDYSATLNDTINLFSRIGNAFQSSFYLQDKWRLANFLNLTLGLRTTYYDPTYKVYYEPRASITFDLTTRLKLTGAWGQYHQYIHRI